MRIVWIIPLLVVIASPGLLDAQWTVAIMDADGEPGDIVTVEVSFIIDDDADEPAGFQYGVCHDDLVELDDVDDGPGLDDIDADFATTATYDGGFTIGVALFGGATIDPGEYVIHEADYELGLDPGLSDIEFCGTLGAPSVSVEVVVDLATETPDMLNGVIDIVDPGGPDADHYTLAITDGTGPAGETATVTVEMRVDEDDGLPVAGVQFGICHDDMFAGAPEAEDIVRTKSLADLDPEIEVIEILDEGWTAAVVVIEDDTGFDAEDQPLYDVTYTLGDEVGDGVLEFCDTLGDPALETGIDSGVRIFAPGTLVAGTVEITDPIPQFLRGDANSSGDVAGVPDGLFLLRWQFAGGDDPTCEDAADADGDGEVSGLPDGLFVLRWQFDGGPTPPDPGVTTCGVDPEDEPDELGCETTSEFCE